MATNDPQAIGTLPSDAQRKSKRRRRIFLILAILIVGGLTLTSILAETCERILPVYRMNCANNMRQIGLAAIMYASAHGNEFPDSLKTLVETEDLGNVVCICPADPTQGQAHPIATSQPALGAMGNSYIYVGDGLRSDVPNSEDWVILYEPLSNHQNDKADMFAIFSRHMNDGMNVLFADGHVEALTPAQAETILKQASAGTRPIIYHSTASTQP
jgi:prepilin-type processing-associated H-X9-DG protein